MSYTNSTPNYNLPQWIGTDKPTFLGDFNGAFSAIDTAMKDNADASSAATSTANAANATAVSANTNANTALNTANNAKDTADAATVAAAGATSTANTAKTTADNAARAALSNNIANLAPAYDNTLTYAVGDLVSYIDQNNTGHLYRCIVAVNVPGDFNINYWDDVTASEVFEPKMNVLHTTTADGVKTYADLYHELHPYIVAAPDVTKTKIRSNESLTTIYNFDEYNGSTEAVRYTSVKPTSTNLVTNGLVVGTSSATLTRIVIATGGTTFSDFSTDVPTAGYTYELIG